MNEMLAKSDSYFQIAGQSRRSESRFYDQRAARAVERPSDAIVERLELLNFDQCLAVRPDQLTRAKSCGRLC